MSTAIVAGALFAALACHDTAVGPAVRAPLVRSTRPNLVFFLADDMRWDAAGYTGNPIIQTPNLDALAHNGVSFKNAYVTSPICAISRASIFTGQYSRRHNILDFSIPLSPNQQTATYPALLHAAGYQTGFIGKFGVGDNPPSQLFDFWRGFAGQGSYLTTDTAGQPIHLTRLMTQQAIEFLQHQQPDHPFVLSVSFKAPHVQDDGPRRFIPEAQDEHLYSSTFIPPPATADDVFWSGFPDFFRTNNLARIRWQELFSTPDQYQASVKGYYQLITGMDRAIGLVRAELTRLGLADNTVIVFTSDNGFFLGELGMSHKWYGQEPSVRVPMVIYDPRDPTGQGGRIDASIALNVDVAPTLLDLASVPIPAAMQGRSLVQQVHKGGPGPLTDFLFEHLYVDPTIRRSTGVVGGRYKYLKYLDPTPNYEVIYDLGLDPNETINFAQDPRYASILDSLRKRHATLVAKAR